MMRVLTVLLIAIFCFANAVRAASPSLPFVFGDHAVIQRDMPVRVWGRAEAGKEVRVEFAGQSQIATAAADGKWSVTLQPLSASSEGRAMTITSGDETVSLRDVLVGEVWLCSGQSNMGKPVGGHGNQKPTVDHKKELAAADFPNVRLMVVRREGSDAKMEWQPCTPQSLDASNFSAAGYFFGRTIHQELNVPVGLIQSAVGGTRIEAWTSPDGFTKVASLREWADAGKSNQRVGRVAASGLYRSMIEPLAGFAIRGTLWYQGEANTWIDDGAAYTEKTRALVAGWRDAWGQGDFPFYFVQLAPYRYSARAGRKCPPDALPRLREAQTKSLDIPNTAMVVTTDLVDDLDDIHPVRKREVGARLAACALARDYGRKGVVYTGPTYRSVEIRGAECVLSFDHAEGLKSRDAKPLTDFTIAGEDAQFVPAEARIDKETVVVSSHRIATPKFIRFGWSETATPNLANGAGLPAVPFRTDSLPR